jgi:hypothetical protein
MPHDRTPARHLRGPPHTLLPHCVRSVWRVAGVGCPAAACAWVAVTGTRGRCPASKLRNVKIANVNLTSGLGLACGCAAQPTVPIVYVAYVADWAGV